MALPSLPSTSAIPSLSAEERAGVLDLLFEPCIQLHTLSVSSLSENQFLDYKGLIDHVQSQLDALFKSDLASDQTWLEAILSAHPRLGATVVTSTISKAEQAGLKASAPEDHDETEKLRALNEKYEEKFPGLIYVTFVNSRPRPVIMQDMQDRINTSTIEKEKQDAIKAMCEIALSRAQKYGAK